MTAAYDLVRAGRQVTIFEANDYVGGLASGFKEPHWDWYVERYYHHWFQTDNSILGLMRELNLRDKVFFPRPFTVMYHEDQFYPFDSIPAALMFPGLGWGAHKIRFGLVGLYLKLTNNWRPLEKTTVEKWMRNWAGDYVYETMWKPLLQGKFGPYYQDVNMAWMWARLKSRTTRLGTYEGGFQRFAKDFENILRELGVEFHLSTPVQTIRPKPEGGLIVETETGSTPFSQVLTTTSPGLLARMAPDLPKSYLEGLLSLKSLGAVVMVLSLKQRVSKEGYYWFNIPKSAGFPFLAMVEHTNFLPPEYFGDEHIVYCGDYLPKNHEYFSLTKEQLLSRFLPGIHRINPEFQPAWINKTWLFRTHYAQPVPLVNHSKNIPNIQTPITGLYFASMSQVYPWDRGTNYAVKIGREAAKLMVDDH